MQMMMKNTGELYHIVAMNAIFVYVFETSFTIICISWVLPLSSSITE